MRMRDKKAARAQAASPGPCRSTDYQAPNNIQTVPLRNILQTNQQANATLQQHRENMRRGVYEWSPELEQAHQNAERSRIGRPGGSTFTRENMRGEG